jgi:hypothetical protein
MRKVIAAAVITSAASCVNAAEIPDTPAGRALAMWVNAVNSGDEAKLQAYIDKYHRKSTAKDYLYLHQAVGDLTLLKIEKNEPNDVVVVLGEANSDDALRSEFRTDSADPTRLVFAQSAGTDRPDDVAIPRLHRSGRTGARVLLYQSDAAEALRTR